MAGHVLKMQFTCATSCTKVNLCGTANKCALSRQGCQAPVLPAAFFSSQNTRDNSDKICTKNSVSFSESNRILRHT